MNRLDFKKLYSLNGPILITGHTGFKGQWLTFLLEELGLKVVGISKEPLKQQNRKLYQTSGLIKVDPSFFLP